MSECKSCTLCCELLPVKQLNKPANVTCVFCDRGCTIYDNKPNECTQFNCAYYQMEKVSEDLRPDNCKIIFERVSDNIFIGTYHPDYGLTDIAKKQIVAFGKQGFSTIIMSPDNMKPILYLGDGHDLKIITEEWQHLLTQRI